MRQRQTGHEEGNGYEIKQEPKTRNMSNKTPRLSKTEQKYFIIQKNK